jgi:copper chaperone
LLDWIFTVTQAAIPQLDTPAHHHTYATGWLSSFWAITLLLVIAFSYLRSPHKESGLSPGEVSDDIATDSTDCESAEKTERLEFTVAGMTCNHCVENVSKTLRQSPGVRCAEVNLKEGLAIVVGVQLDPAQLSSAINSLGYEMRLLE